MSATVNFAVLGVGAPNQNLGGHAVYNGIGEVHGHFLAETPGAQLVACCDRSEENGRLYAAKFGVDFHADYAELLARDDVHAVAVCTPSGLHGEHAIQAIRAGKHVVVEKPLDISTARIDAVLEEVEKAGTRAAVVFPTRYYKGINALKEALDCERFGTPALLNALCRRHRDDRYYQGWRGTWAFDGGGACMNQGIHMIDAILYLMPDVETVQARWGTLGHDTSHCEVEDTAAAVLTFRRGTIGVLECTTCAWPDHGERIDVHAMHGSVSIAGTKVLSWQSEDPQWQLDPAELAELDEEFTGHRLLYADLVPYFRDGGECRCAIETGRRSVALIEAIYESARSGGIAVWPRL
jgi:predicted dehydrogenase